MAPARTWQQRLLVWFRVAGRDLPWRRTMDAYAITISELMLQQTQVSRVVEKYTEWLHLFPTWEALAAASQAEVLRAWSGLGYNRRALNVHRLAKAVVAQGGLPRTVQGLVALPGIGPYTARALVAFAWRGRAAPVDVNIARILQRVTGYRAEGRDLQELADRQLPRNAWAYNHAMMDLGATICTARNPRCATCPLQTVCASAFAVGDDRPTKKQATFKGSDRQLRGQLLRLLTKNSILRRNEIGKLTPDFSAARVDAALAALEREGFLQSSAKGWYTAPV